jgi:hypothetical protein
MDREGVLVRGARNYAGLPGASSLDYGQMACSAKVQWPGRADGAMLRVTVRFMNEFQYFFGRWMMRNGDSLVLRTPFSAAQAVEFYRVTAIRSKDTVYMRAIGIDGSMSFRQTFPRGALPHSQASFWSVIAFDTRGKCVLPNVLNRSLLSQGSYFEFNSNGSLTLAFAPVLPYGVARSNWLPTQNAVRYNLIYRFYAPRGPLLRYTYQLPPLIPEPYTPAGGIR